MSMERAGENRQILEEASAWFVDARLGQLDRSRRSEMMAWLQRSPEHIRAYLEISGTYAVLPRPAETAPGDIERLLEQARSRASNVTSLEERKESLVALVEPVGVRTSRLRRPMWIAASVAFISLSVALVAWAVLARGTVYSTQIGEHRSIALDDGSKVELNARTKVRVAYTANARRIELLEGQALFHVAKDSQRPFTVDSAGTLVRAIGTQFDVHRRRSGTTVTVIEGRVALFEGEEDDQGAPVASGSGAAAAPISLGAGEQVMVGAGGMVRPERVNAAAATAWTHGELEFDETRLVDVAEEFNRHHRAPLVIESPSLEDFRISGIYSLEDPLSLVRFLRNQPDLVVTETREGIRIRNK